MHREVTGKVFMEVDMVGQIYKDKKEEVSQMGQNWQKLCGPSLLRGPTRCTGSWGKGHLCAWGNMRNSACFGQRAHVEKLKVQGDQGQMGLVGTYQWLLKPTEHEDPGWGPEDKNMWGVVGKQSPKCPHFLVTVPRLRIRIWGPGISMEYSILLTLRNFHYYFDDCHAKHNFENVEDTGL